ncbi:acyltransferase family protein [Nesterenkonia sp. NBAIMH1]|uniref:acyltransferase family protein n=1 Tax=Nesterenkonia sp. NBAIMH1 TaxID=2600320 RepID=UPI001FEE5C60|nr:acyltransferase family protein [Nesterenkonia sp. NBAIMH1]
MEQLAERPAPTPAAPQRARPTGLRKRRPAEGTRSRIHGLDGLRALAVVLVIVYHINPSWAPGGFVGVDVFFVISGFLITSLLIREYRDRGRIDLKRFYVRRARRLVPAIVLVVAACTLAAAALGGDVLTGLGWQLVGIFTFTANWTQMAASFDYFNASQAGLFDNFWSLAIEEQFYLLWPVLLIAFLVRARLPKQAFARMRANLIALAVVSTVLMLGLVHFGQANIAYLATVSHLYGLLLGAALAFSPKAFLKTPPVSAGAAGDASGHASGSSGGLKAEVPASRVQETAAVVGRGGLALLMTAAGLAAIGLLTFSAWAETPGREPLLTLGGTLAGLLLVGACLIGPAGLSRWGDVSLLGWIGTRSYGLYLWHFPLIVLADHLMAAHRIPLLELLDQYQVRVLAVIVAVAAAEASYRWVEMPVRRHGFGHVLKAPARAAAAGTIVAALVASIAWSQTSSPESTSLQTLLAEGQEHTQSFAGEDEDGLPAEDPADDQHDTVTESFERGGLLPGGPALPGSDDRSSSSAADEEPEAAEEESDEADASGPDPTPEDVLEEEPEAAPSEAVQEEAAPSPDAGEPEPQDPSPTDSAPSPTEEASASEEPPPSEDPTPSEEPTPEDEATDSEEEAAPEEAPAVESGSGASMVAVGDSVMLASSGALTSRFDVVVDAAESRQLVSAPDIVSAAVSQVPSAETVVLGVGINGVGSEADVTRAVSAAGDRTVILVNLYGPMAFVDSHNAMLQSVAASRSNVRVADWNSRADANTHCLQADQVHPTGECTAEYAAAVASAL